ncbi:MAG: EF-hand domain-containing protein [Desulfuromonadales bacterium]|nr:EF-hand domain-containing protein [Desulfuromonadales bacterium]NIS41820.1 EF-hand domain-containing protein [Desulfuromonadales bacterium]
MRKLVQTFAIALTAIFLAGSPASAVDAATALQVLDPDNDGTIDMKEAIRGAKRVFRAINPDRDGTLDAAELRGRLSAAGLEAADPDDDGTLNWREYKRLVKAMFEAANPDGDGTIDLRELSSPAGQRLLKLIYL